MLFPHFIGTIPLFTCGLIQITKTYVVAEQTIKIGT